MSPRGRIGSRAYRRTYTRRVYAISITAPHPSPPRPPRRRPPQTAFRRARTRNGKDSPFSTARSNETVRSSEPENTFIMRKSAGIAHRGLLSCPVSRGRGQFSFGDFPRYRSAVCLSNLSSLCLSPPPRPLASTRKSILPRNGSESCEKLNRFRTNGEKSCKKFAPIVLFSLSVRCERSSVSRYYWLGPLALSRLVA